MFETSRVTSHVAVQRRFGVFTASIFAHTAVIAGVIVATVSSVSFPVNAPNEMSRFNTVMRIEMPRPPGVRHAQPVSTPSQPHVATLPANTAPTQIPDAVIPATTTDAANADPHGVDGPATGEGDRDGVVGGVDVGQPVAHAEPPPVEIYHPGGDVRPAAVLHRVSPDYPRAALLSRLSGNVVVQCVIDREGNVREPQVVRSSFAIFEEPALHALRQWKFTPGMLHGKPVETYFELTIMFQPR